MHRILTTAAAVITAATLGLTATTAHADTGSKNPFVTPVTLAKAASAPSTMHMAAGYLHADNCRVALVGGNGDNDVQAWINTHTPYGINGYSALGPGPRYGDNAVIYYYDLYRNSVWWGSQAGYCMGTDANITDKFGDPPAGW